jgi:hypothetical protein
MHITFKGKSPPEDKEITMKKLIFTAMASLSILALTACGGSSSSNNSSSIPGQFNATTSNAFTDFVPAQGGAGFPGPQSALTTAFVPNALFSGFNTGLDTALYKIDISGENLFRITGSPFILPGSSGKSISSNLNFADANNALACVSDNTTGANALVYLFNPTTINDSGDFRPVDLSIGTLLQVTPQPNAIDSNGTAVTTPYEANFPVGAAAFTINNVVKLFVGFSNSASFPVTNPGTILVYDLDLTMNPVSVVRSGTIFTTRYNPSALSIYDNGQGQGPQLYVTCEGAGMANFTDLTGSVEVFDPATQMSVTNIDLGTTNPVGKVIVNDQGTRGYIGTNPGGSLIRVHEIDLVNNTAIQTFATTEVSVGSNFSNPVAVNASGDFVYQQLQGDRRIVVYNRNTGQQIDSISTPIPAPRSTVPFTDTPTYMARRRGDNLSLLYSVVSLQGGAAAVDVIVPTFR